MSPRFEDLLPEDMPYPGPRPEIDEDRPRPIRVHVKPTSRADLFRSIARCDRALIDCGAQRDPEAA